KPEATKIFEKVCVSPPRPPGHPQYPPVPPYPQGPKVPPKDPTVHSCDVEDSQKVPCGNSDITAAACDAISCCFDGRHCYYGKAVTVQCTKDAQFIVVVAKDATLPNLDLESISLLGTGPRCAFVDSNADFAIYQFPVTQCGTVVKEETGVLIYENRMSSSYEVGVGPRGAITRDSHYEYILLYQLVAIQRVVTKVSVCQSGSTAVFIDHVTMLAGILTGRSALTVDAAYSSFYTDADYPVTKVLRDPVYVEVRLLEKTDPNLVLTLGRCWTTTDPNPHSLCPYRDDRYLSTLVPVGPFSGVDFPTHYRRFIFKMFTFVDPTSLVPQKEKVYIHCSTAVCTVIPGRSCEPSCFRKKRNVRAVDQKQAQPNVVVSSGPVIMGAPSQ
uniref:Zona pellucida sperm-binding protein 4 n=1 Tax=Mastacembelus armatus TaxID=205130 RepID=A0A7N8WLQ6_9TELE